MKVTIYQNPVIIKVLSHDPLGSRDKKCELKSWGFTSQFVNEILLWNQKIPTFSFAALQEKVFVYVDFTFVEKASIFPLADTLCCRVIK